MEAQEIRYRVNKKVFRQASLYAMFLRNRNTFRVGIAVVRWHFTPCLPCRVPFP